MSRIPVRIKLMLLVVFSVLALLFVGGAGWIGLQRVAAAMHDVSEQRLAAVRWLGVLRASLLEAIVTVQEGAAWKLEKYETLMPDEAELLDEGRNLLASVRERYDEASKRANDATGCCPRAPGRPSSGRNCSPCGRTSPATTSGRPNLPAGSSPRRTGRLSAPVSWSSKAMPARWEISYATLDVPLSKLAATSVEEAALSRAEGDRTVATVTRLLLGAAVLVGVLLAVLGAAIVRSVVGSLETMRSTLVHIAETHMRPQRQNRCITGITVPVFGSYRGCHGGVP